MVKAKGGIVPELNCRHGRRLAKRKERRQASRNLATRRSLLPPVSLLREHLPDNSVEHQPEFDELKHFVPPPTKAEFKAMDVGELRRRCGIFALPQTGSQAALAARIDAHCNVRTAPETAVVAWLTEQESPDPGAEDSDDEENEWLDADQPDPEPEQLGRGKRRCSAPSRAGA